MDEQVKILLAAQDQISKVLDSVEGKLDQVVSAAVDGQKALQKVFDAKIDKVSKQTNELKKQLGEAKKASAATNKELRAAFAKKSAAILAQVSTLRNDLQVVKKNSKDTTTQLRQLMAKKSQGLINQIIQIRKDMAAAKKAATETNQKLKEAFAKKSAALVGQISTLKTRLTQAKTEAKEADAALKAIFTKKVSGLIGQVRTLRQEVAKLKESSRGGLFGASAAGIGGGILGRGTGLMAGYGLGRAFGIYGGLAGAIYSVQRGMAESIRTTAEYRTAMQYAAAVANATRQQTEQLGGVIRELGALTEFTASQVADGARFLAQAGFEFQEVLQALPGMLELAAAGSMDLGQAADIVTNILRGFNLEVQRLNEVSDVLAHVASTSNTNIVQMGHAFSYAAPTARAAGEDFHEVAAALAILADAGIRGERAGTSLRQAYIRLQSMPESVAKEFEKLGIRIRSTADGTVDLSEVIDQLADKNVELPGIFQARALAAMQQLVLNADRLKRLELDVLLDSIGRASQISEQKLEGMPRLVRELASAWEDLKLDIGESDFATKLVEDLRDVVRWLANVEDPVDNINKALDLFANEFENRLDLVGPRVDDLVNRIETLNSRLVELGEKKRHVFGIASSFPGPEGFGPADPLSSSFTASQAEEAFRRWEAMRNRARDREREAEEERSDAERKRIDRLAEIAQRYNAIRSAEKAAVAELVRLWNERDRAEAEAVKEHWENLDRRLELYQRVSEVMQRDLHRFHTVGIPSFEGPVPNLTGGPGANAGLKDAEKLWESNTEKLRQFQQVVQLTRQVTDDLAQRFLAATAQMIQGWLYMTAAIKSAEMSSVILAVISMVLSLINALKGLGATSEEIKESNEALASSLDAVRSSALTSAEAIDRYLNWQGNEEGHQFLLNVIDDFETIGRTAAEAEQIVGDYWAAMRRGDQGTMERLGQELIQVADSAAEVRRELEEAGDEAEDLQKKFEDAFSGAKAAVEDYLISTGVLSENWLDRQANIAKDAAGEHGLIWETLDKERADAIETLAEIYRVNMDQILEDGIVTADEFLVIWGALPDGIRAIFASALEDMGFDLSDFLSNISDSIDSFNREQERERQRAAREAEREVERRAREAEREAERIARAIEQAIAAGIQRVRGMLGQFESAGFKTANDYLRSMLSMLANPIWDRVGMAKEDFEGLIDSADALGIALVDVHDALNAAVLQEQLGNVDEEIQNLIDSGIELDRILGALSDNSVRAIGRMALAAHQLGIELTDAQKAILRMYASMRLGEIENRLQEIHETRALRALDRKERAIQDEYDAVMDRFDAEEKAIRDAMKASKEFYDEKIEKIRKEGKAAIQSIDDQIDALRELLAEHRKVWKEREDAAKKAADAAKERLADQEKAARAAASAEKERLSDLEKAARTAAAAEKERLDAQEKAARAVADVERERLDTLKERLELQRVDTEKAWAAAQAFGIRDRSRLGSGYHAQFASERILQLAEQVRLLQATGLSDQELSKMHVIQTRIARAAGDVGTHGLSLPKNLQGIAGILGFSGLRTGSGKTALEDQIDEIAKSREQVEAELTKKLDAIAKQREQVEAELTKKLDAIAKQREQVENNLKSILDRIATEREQVEDHLKRTLESIAAERERIEGNINAQLEYLADERKNIERNMNAEIERLQEERDQIEDDFNAKLEVLAAAREVIEAEFNAKLKVIQMQREAIEDARLQREIEREEVEMERLRAERDLLKRVLSMLNGAGGSGAGRGAPAPDPRYPNFDPNDPWNAYLLTLYDTIHEVQQHKIRKRGYREGTGGLMDFGDWSPAILHRKEAVVTEQSWMQAIERAAAGGRQGGQLQVVNFELDGLGFGRATMRWQTKAAHLEGVR